MTNIQSDKQLWGKDFPIGGEWDAGYTPAHTPPENSGRWTVRREETRFTVVFHRFHGRPEVQLAEYPPTEQGEIEANTCAISAYETNQTNPISHQGA